MKKTQEEIIQEIIELVLELGWNVIIPTGSDECDGLVIGNDNFLNELNLDIGSDNAKKGIH